MKPDDEIFGEALALPAGEREAFLTQVCGDDAARRARLAALLAGHGQSWNLLETLARRPVALPEEKAGDVIGRYKLLQKIGEGGCGSVYMAEQEEPVRRRVALKVIKLGMDTREVIARFEAERQALALMDHPNIARVLEAGATGTGRPFFAMELVRGVPITRFCDEQHFSTVRRLRLFVQVCHAVQHAHQKGVVHRDLKPSNILVTLHDGEAVPKVIDFGIAKATQGRLTDHTVFTAFEQFVGTPAYMSPEQAELSGFDVDTRADVYSLGVLLYELLTGRTPFDAKELAQAGLDEMRRRIREVEPPAPSTRLGTLEKNLLTGAAQCRGTEAPKLINLLRGDLDWIVMRCLEKDRTRRYETATSLAQDLLRHLNDEPVLARPAGRLYRFRKTVRRHRLAFGAGVAIFAALVIGLGFSAWSLVRERRAETHARRLLYAADMNLAQQSLTANNLARTRLLLDRHRPNGDAEADVRGWEWRYLWQQSRSEAVAELNHHGAAALSMSYAPDNRRLAVGYADGRVELWDAVARSRLKVLVETASSGGKVAFSPRGNLLVATVGPGVLEWHDLTTGEFAVRCRVTSAVRDLAFSADGSRLLVTTLGETSLYVVDADDGRVLDRRDVPTGRSPYLDGARFSPDLERVYYSMLDDARPKVRCARLSDWSTLWEIDGGEREGISALEVSPDGRWLVTATGYERDAIRVWDATSGAAVATLGGHTKWVARLAFSANSRVLASGSSDQTVRLWDTATWRETARLRGHIEEVYSLAISPDGSSVVSGSEDGAVLLWNMTAQRPAGGRKMLPAHVASAWLLPGGQAAMAMTTQREFSVIALATLQERPLPAAAPERRFFVPPNVFSEYDGRERVQVYEVLADGRKTLGSVIVGKEFANGFAYLPGRRLFAWSDGVHTLHVVKLDAPTQRTDFVSPLEPIAPFNFSSDGRAVRATWASSVGVVWDLATKQPIEPNDMGWFTADTRDAQIGAGNRPLLPLEQAGRMRLLRADAREGAVPAMSPARRFRDRADIGSLSGVALSGDGRVLAVSSETGFLAICDPANIASLTILTGNMQDVDGVAFSPDSRRLATTSHGDEMVKLWDVETRQELITLAGEGSEIYAVEFSDDGNTLLVGRRPFVGRALSGLCQFWTVPSWEEIRAMESGEARARTAK